MIFLQYIFMSFRTCVRYEELFVCSEIFFLFCYNGYKKRGLKLFVTYFLFIFIMRKIFEAEFYRDSRPRFS
jgi:hypothetical protein